MVHVEVMSIGIDLRRRAGIALTLGRVAGGMEQRRSCGENSAILNARRQRPAYPLQSFSNLAILEQCPGQRGLRRKVGSQDDVLPRPFDSLGWLAASIRIII